MYCKRNKEGDLKDLQSPCAIGGAGNTAIHNKMGRRTGDGRERSRLWEIFKMKHSTAIDSNTTEIDSKCLAHWYITPEKSNKYQKEIS